MAPRTSIRVLILLAWLSCELVASAAETPQPDFLNEVFPLLKDRCVKCHGPAKQKGRLNLSVPPAIARGGKSGPAIVPGKLNESLLWKLVESGKMPEDEPLRAEEKDLLRRWIASGARGLPDKVSAKPDGDEHWAFAKLTATARPLVRDRSRIRTPIDEFIQARLEAAGLSMGPEADRRTLIRRVSIDLTGLPPTPREIDAFLNDTGERAYEDMVERYLASPRYGERWGKYWLDASGYADSNGYFNADTDRPLAYRYRDYVIRSINADKPFDRFITEQLAGDELSGFASKGKDVTPDTIELLEATHYLRNSPDGTDSSDGNEDEVRADKYAVLEGELQIIGSSLLGITVQCARCHDHKFEPFRQRDYYQLQAVLYPAFNIDRWAKTKDRQVVAASAAQVAAYESANRKIDEQLAAGRAELRQWSRDNREQGRVLFEDGFDDPKRKLAENWSNTAPGDTTPAGKPAVNIDSSTAPAAQAVDGSLRIIESGGAGDRAVSTRQSFDWTPDEGNWVQVTFDLVKGSEYVAYFVALRDFDDSRGLAGGNILLDGAKAGGVNIHLDYPGSDSRGIGPVSKQSYVAGRNYGVRITNAGGGKYELAHVVDGVVEDGSIKLVAADLPDGGFGFEYCCGRSFTVDNLLIEAGESTLEASVKRRELIEMIRKKRADHDAAIKAIEATRPKHPGLVAAVTDLSPKMPDVFLLERGLYKLRKEKVEARAPEVLSDAGNPSALAGRASEVTQSTGVRLSLARWLTQPDSRASSLLARVTVNRWWQHHFAAGIVATSDNLGYSGSPPTHPELLEYLAGELVRGKWSAKAIHRLILHSAVYRQSSLPRADGQRVEPANRLLWRYPLRRLDAESIRDAMLAISGEQDPKMGGPYVPTSRTGEGDVVVAENVAGALRRSVYLQQRRTQVTSILDVFDAPSIVANCTMRSPTTIPLQSLKLLNSDFARRRATAFARRVLREVEGATPARIDHAFILAVGRPPTKDELSASIDFLAKQPNEYPNQADAGEKAWIDFANLLLSMNAFLYVE